VNNWRKFWKLTAEERTVLLSALALLPVVRVGLEALGLRRLQQRLAAGRPSSFEHARLTQAELVRARRVARLVAVASDLTGGSCLARSIVLARILENKGIAVQLRIGVRRGEQGIEAHAWVEADGSILNDGPDVTGRFAAFDRDFALARGNWR
jgi:hypothetical protein